MDDAYSLIKRSLTKKGLKSQASASENIFTIQNWLKGQSPTIAEHIEVQSITKEEVTLLTHNAIAAQTLQSLIPELQVFVQERLKINPVRIIQRRK